MFLYSGQSSIILFKTSTFILSSEKGYNVSFAYEWLIPLNSTAAFLYSCLKLSLRVSPDKIQFLNVRKILLPSPSLISLFIPFIFPIFRRYIYQQSLASISLLSRMPRYCSRVLPEHWCVWKSSSSKVISSTLDPILISKSFHTVSSPKIYAVGTITELPKKPALIPTCPWIEPIIFSAMQSLRNESSNGSS